ncbi:hypothetical protein CQW23_04859 [Capsicum baccatum]|uniref:PDZ domain-containing protein n=1 Tax=Capsicum baccatum TaxID=33114 RepID=A0A2G2XFU5_CAPBA|nr:hypothetical protein CQW23_04859 [Capsicum baccatum]
MNLDSYKRKRKEAFTPWKREPPYSPDDVRESITLSRKEQSFYLFPQNRVGGSKRPSSEAGVRARRSGPEWSPPPRHLRSRYELGRPLSGEEEIFQCSGTIIESFNTYSIILTTASLLRCSTSRNSIADNVKLQSDTPLPSASLAHISDSITIDPIHLRGTEEKCPRSNSVDLIPGDAVIALGRFYKKPFDIMAATGEFRAFSFLLKCGIGGPLINRYGEVIADLDILENIIPKFPEVLKGVIVEEVVPGSSAESAGIKHNDVIIQFAGKRVHSFLELFENMWNNVGESVELAVIRSSHDSPVQLSMVVEERLINHSLFQLATLGNTMTFQSSYILRVACRRKKRTRQLSVLSDVKVCAILVAPNGEVDTWPENPTELNPIIQYYKEHVVAGKRKVIDGGLFKNKSKSNNVALFCDNGDDDEWIKNLSKQSLLVKLNTKLAAVEKRIEFLKMANNAHTGSVISSSSRGK